MEPSVEIDSWLAEGGMVVAASERAARAIAADYQLARRREGLAAWVAPRIQDWHSFIRSAWTSYAPASRLILNAIQEQSLWAEIARESEVSGATILAGPLHRLAALAMEAHGLLCEYAPKLLNPPSRRGWFGDSAAFSRWLTMFRAACGDRNAIAPAEVAVELIAVLEGLPAARPPLLLAGFDRISPTRRSVLSAWGSWRELPPCAPAESIHFYTAESEQAELDACAIWAARCLSADRDARLLIVMQNISENRGRLERTLLRHLGSPAAAPPFEFSLGVPLGSIDLVRAGHLLLRWLWAPLAEHELDWLFASGHAVADGPEAAALQQHMWALRRRNLERPEWPLEAFLQSASSGFAPLPAAWAGRVRQAHARLSTSSREMRSPLAWSELASRLLADLAWPGARSLSSAEFQAERRFQQSLDAAASLGFDGRRISWIEWASVLARALDQTLYAPESRGVPIQISGPSESAGLRADAVWFLGADQDRWPASGSPHPLLPIEVQRAYAMPHAAAKLDWDLAAAATARLICSAAEVRFSCVAQKEGAAAAPSRLVVQHAGQPIEIPLELRPAPAPAALTVDFFDQSLVPFAGRRAPGGSDVLTAQSNCPFKAFATTRLGAWQWRPAEAGLTAAQRGQLLHAALRSVWAGRPNGIRTSAELKDRLDAGIESFVAGHVQSAFQERLPSSARERMPARYLELEQERLVRLVAQWLAYEQSRAAFQVEGTEVPAAITIAGLELNLRLDRIDRLSDGTLLVIDYKTGEVDPKCWNPPRPEDVQLPLYAVFAPGIKDALGGLAFARIQSGKREFAGCVTDARSLLLPRLRANANLYKRPLTPRQISDWRQSIERLAGDFMAGRANADPRAFPGTCERCGLQTVCRILENRHQTGAESEAGEDADG